MTVVVEQNLRAVRDLAGAVELLSLLGYDTSRAKYADATDYGLQGSAHRINSSQKRREGYGVLVVEIDELPRSLRRFSRLLIEVLHNSPLAVIGIRNGEQTWREWHVVRPRLVPGGAGAVSSARLTVDPRRPTKHDLEVIRQLAWSADRTDVENRRAIDGALDVERVTSEFFKGLNVHYARLVDELRELAETNPAVRAGVSQMDAKSGPDRVALRILTQTLFCYFLQRKGLLRGEPRWLSKSYATAITENRQFYAEVMEPLFYEWLNTPEALRTGDVGRGIPFLNGGLFDRRYGTVSLPLSNELFSTDDGLLGFLDGYSFTVSEDTADEAEVAVDPEMLGKVFENLLAEDNRKREGTVYTPRPVVQFMCREALVPWLQRRASIDEPAARSLVTSDSPFDELAEATGAEEAARVAAAVDAAIEEIRILDPAVGSGAFLLGMLSELLRLRQHAYITRTGRTPTSEQIDQWKLHAIERNLFGVDINPTAIELCRLRLWLSLLVDAPVERIRPLPNLEYRTVCADSLTDYLGGVEVQRTPQRWHEPQSGQAFEIELPDPTALLRARDEYFEASAPSEKTRLREALAVQEDEVVAQMFSQARRRAEERSTSARADARALGEQVLENLAPLENEFHGRDRAFPLFVPAFHAPDVMARGGWDVVIMNPPYVGRKEVARRLPRLRIEDLRAHYGRTYDLMIHFGIRAIELVRDGGVVSMIFNDSIFNSVDADDFRRTVIPKGETSVALHALSRTKCFEGVAVNGGVVIASRTADPDPDIRWAENAAGDGRTPADLLAATEPTGADWPKRIGASDLFEAPREPYMVLPHRPFFRPSTAALTALKVFPKIVAWDELGTYRTADSARKNGRGDWVMLSETARLGKYVAGMRASGAFDRLKPGHEFIPVGFVAEGGQGLATADDRRFLGVLEGTPEAAAAEAHQERLRLLLESHAEAKAVFEDAMRDGGTVTDGLIAVNDRWVPKDVGWPKSGVIRIVPRRSVRRGALSEAERLNGIADDTTWVPFEKGDTSNDDGGGSPWSRRNVLFVDWSPSSVRLIRSRAAKGGARSPRLQNELLWGKGGVTWNTVARYLRAREVPAGGIFGHMAPMIRPTVPWLTVHGLLAVLNAPVSDFILRTFIGSLMHIEVGDLRRLPIPVLSEGHAAELDRLGSAALVAKQSGPDGGQALRQVEADIDALTRRLYGFGREEEFWVVR